MQNRSVLSRRPPTRRNLLRDEHGRREIGAHDFIPGFSRKGAKRLPFGDAGIVHEDVEPSTCGRQGDVKVGANGIKFAHIPHDRRHFIRAIAGTGTLKLFTGATGDNHLRTAGDAFARNGQADATTTARHQNLLPRQALRRLCLEWREINFLAAGSHITHQPSKLFPKRRSHGHPFTFRATSPLCGATWISAFRSIGSN